VAALLVGVAAVPEVAVAPTDAEHAPAETLVLKPYNETSSSEPEQLGATRHALASF
jgi:hypothetical protein